MSDDEGIWKKVCRNCNCEYPNHNSCCSLHYDVERVVGIHDGCGGDIVRRRDHRYCKKCDEYFCGCASGG